jgi:hypothetical protein
MCRLRRINLSGAHDGGVLVAIVGVHDDIRGERMDRQIAVGVHGDDQQQTRSPGTRQTRGQSDSRIAPNLRKAGLCDWLGLTLCPQPSFSATRIAGTRGAEQRASPCVDRATWHGCSRAASVGPLYKETGLREIGRMKTEFIVVAALALGCLFSAGRLCAETEPQGPPAADPAPSPPAGIIVTPPVSIPLRPEMRPPANSPPSCPATDRELELIG